MRDRASVAKKRPSSHAAFGAEIAPFLGYYEGGYSLLLVEGTPHIRIVARVLPLRALPDGSYVTTAGLLPALPVHLTRGADGVSRMELEGLETIGRTVGFD